MVVAHFWREIFLTNESWYLFEKMSAKVMTVV